MKEQKPVDQEIQKELEPGQQLEKSVHPSQEDSQAIIQEEGDIQKLNKGEDQNSRSANNETIGIP